MGGDYSRKSFDVLRDFAGVLMQQGHVTLDSDWNEYVALVERRLRAQTVDVIGRAVVPRETPTGFQIGVAAGPTLTIGRGRMYVDGLLAENHGRIGPGAAPIFDRSRLEAGKAVGVLDEPISRAPGDFVDYAAQPYLPAPPALPTSNGPHLVYLDVWNREVTPLKDPRLLEPALNGIDSATRVQTVWQVRVLPNVGAGATCGADLAAWDALVAPSAARLTTATIEFEDPDEPCLIAPGGGYRGLENQLYRVEIHTGGGLGAARFKWSRDNASVGATVEAIQGGDRLQVRRIGRDSVLRFRTGDWVEITDDRREFAGLPGDIRRVEVDEDANELRLDAALSADLIPGGGADTTAARHTRVVRWDQRGQVMLADGTPWTDLDAVGSNGLIPIPPAGQAVVLEAGVTVSFALEPAGGQAKALDHWCFAARTSGAQIEILDDAPPVGVQHHYARLAIVTFPGTVVNCRTFWPPEFGGADCACTVCVSAEQHNSGALTIQAAINQLPPVGGTVCLGPGGFLLGETPVTIAQRASVRLTGHGPGSVLVYGGTGGAVRVVDSDYIEIQDLGVFVAAPQENAPFRAAFLVQNSQHVGLSRTVGLMAPRRGSLGFGLALTGNQDDLDVSRNVLLASTAIGALADPELQAYCALGDVRIEGNELVGFRGIALEGLVMHLGNTRIGFNAIGGADVGIATTGTGMPRPASTETAVLALPRNESWSPGGVSIHDNTILTASAGSGIVSGVPNLDVEDNEITSLIGEATAADAACLRLVEGFVPRMAADAQVIGNRMGRTRGAGIRIETALSSLLIKQNLIADCASGAVRSAPEARIDTLAFDNNVVERVGGSLDGEPAVGVELSSVVDGRILGNSIRGVGLASAQARFIAGLQVSGALVLEIAHNTIGDIGADRSPQEMFAIRLEGPIVTADVSANRLIGTAAVDQNDPGHWSGLVLDARIGTEQSSTGAPNEGFSRVNAYPAYVEVGERTMRLSQRGVSTFARAGEVQIRIDGNLITDARARSKLPLVVVLADGGRLSGCTFTGNQCRNLTNAGATPVMLRAARLAVANNLVRRESDADAMDLRSGAFGGPTATIVGNVTFGNVRLNGAALGAPWAPLNVLG